MATEQTKRLKRALIELGISDSLRLTGVPRVRTDRIYRGRLNGRPVYEYGNAVAHTDALTIEQVRALKASLSPIQVRNYPDLGFCIIAH